MKHIISLILLGFGAALAVVITPQMSTDAKAIIIGVTVGVAFSVPVSLVLLALLRDEHRGKRRRPQATFYDPDPPRLPHRQPGITVLRPDLLEDDPRRITMFAHHDWN